MIFSSIADKTPLSLNLPKREIDIDYLKNKPKPSLLNFDYLL